MQAFALAVMILGSGTDGDDLPISLGEDAPSQSLVARLPLLGGDEVGEEEGEFHELLPAPAGLADDSARFSIGPEGGYLNVRGADRGTWFGGVKARLHFARILAAEASITFHRSYYQSDGVVVTQYPVQLTAFLYIIPDGPVRPYILGGVGWYYTRIDYRGALALLSPDKTQHIFGEHLGVGAELMLSPTVSLDADVRYIFLNPTNEQVIHRAFDYWQIAFGVNFYF